MVDGFLCYFDKSSDGVFAAESGGRVIFWNQCAENILGWAARDVLYKPCWEIVGGSDSTGKPFCGPTCPVVQQTSDPPRSFDLEVSFRSGLRRWVNVSIIYGATLPLAGSGAVSSTAIVHLVRDITERRRAEFFGRRVLDMSESVRSAPRPLAVTAGCGSLRLPPRQRLVLELMAQGMTTMAMAREMKVRVSTVRTHVEQTLKSLGAHSRLQAIHLARRQGLLP